MSKTKPTTTGEKRKKLLKTRRVIESMQSMTSVVFYIFLGICSYIFNKFKKIV